MSGQRKCPDCGSLEVVEDSHYAQSQLVCAECGFILTEGLLTTTFTDEHSQAVTYSQSTGQNEQLTRYIQRGIKRIRDLCKVLRLPSLFEEVAVSYYQRAIEHASFHFVSLERKEMLVGCCVFVTCRQHNWPLTMGTLCLLLYAEKELFATTYLRLLKDLVLDVPALGLTDLVKTHLNSFKLFQNASSLPAKFVEDKEQLVARTIQIVELASETWLVTGRHPVPIVTAAAYLAWQSLRPVGRLTYSLSQFCKLAGTVLPPPAHLRLKELHNILIRMGSQLAWLRMFKMDRRSVAKYIGDLLQHRRVLLQSAFFICDAVEDHHPDSSAGASRQDRSAEVEKVSLAGEKRKCGSKRTPLLPPCLLNPRKKLRAADPGPKSLVVTGDEPISDSEIEQYLRTPEEKAAFSQAQAWL